MEYDSITAYHYRSYRPPLHEVLLARHLPAERRYDKGLDVGCGTGASSLALSAYCREVIGIDTSLPMLEHAIPDPQIDYQPFDGKKLEFEDNTFDIITFAGSLYYAKSQTLLDECVRVCRQKALIIVYDFQIHLDPLIQYLAPDPGRASEEEYNHREDFSGLETGKIVMEKAFQEELQINIGPPELIHLLLSSQKNYSLLSRQFGRSALENELLRKIEGAETAWGKRVKSSIYFTLYTVEK
jgi:ubiquinone/menaquinone biosynthesis C-methylase UbiE